MAFHQLQLQRQRASEEGSGREQQTSRQRSSGTLGSFLNMKPVLLLTALTALAVKAVWTLPLDACGGKPADLVFIVDSSSSIWPKHFREHVLTFLHEVIDMLDVGPHEMQTRVGAVTFSDQVYLEFYLKRFMDKEQLLERVKQIRYRGGNTDTHEAIQFVDRSLFRPENGGRSDVTRMVVIITDGESRMAKETVAAAESLKSKNVTVFAIGVGNQIDVAELRAMASQPSSEFVFEVTNFQALSGIKKELVTRTCKACINRPADVYFVLDSSSSIWVHDFETSMLQFVRNVIDIYDIGADRTRVGIITFSDKPRTVFGLEAHVQKEELLKAVNSKSVKYEPGLTYTAEALQTARMNLFQEGRQNADHVLILITDGQSKDPNATLMTAHAAHEDGVTVFTVGVGSGVDVGELHGVASKPSEDFTFMVDDFKGLDSYKAILAARTCGANATLVPPVRPPVNSSHTCKMNHADIIFAYDWSMLGGVVSTQIISTIHRVSATFDVMAADVTFGSVTSSQCVEQYNMRLSESLELSKQVRSVVRTQQSQMTSVLKNLRISGFSVQNGHRVTAKKVAIIVLDAGSTNKLALVASEAARMRSDDIEVFVITSGRQGGQLVNDIVSEPKDHHIIQLPGLDFSNHAYASDKIVEFLCGDNSAWL
ncbi:hypothetical protein C0Q70_20499 [Pomacea canaliculata]|uniref:VWFA domain-containing protein n=1 Tax=Pomacea canaliculata TaxID=400727 RepID=A0A2T7NFS2_POMCA|nr:hypothetical protein C0Q70_20499 [Pomacea canaliculata]